MEYFFREDSFYTDLSDLINEMDLDDDMVNNLPEDWTIEAEDSALEKIFSVRKERLVDYISEWLCDDNNDRFPEDPDRIIEKINKAISDSIDIEKLNNLLPSLYYPNGTKFTIKKADLVDWVK